MQNDRNQRWQYVGVFVCMTAAYLAVFPVDAGSLVAPFEKLAGVVGAAGRLLEISKSISTWLYTLLGAAIVFWTIYVAYRRADEDSASDSDSATDKDADPILNAKM